MQTLDKGLLLRLALSFGLPILVLMLPIDAIPIDDLTLVQHRLLAIFLLAALLWVLEPVPVFATSILIIALELVMISDKGLHPFRAPVDGHELGHLLPYTDIFSAFSSPHHHSVYGGICAGNCSVEVRTRQQLSTRTA